jgi:predicted nucleic acid-binding Zn ribbon protein
MHSLAHLVPAALMELLRMAPLSDGKVAFAWRAVVGPALERATVVKLDGHVLIVETSSAQWSREVSRSSPMILARLQTFLGKDTVTSISVRAGSTTRGA